MTNYNERLAYIINSLANKVEWCVSPELLSRATVDREREDEAIAEAKQAILDLQNKQIEEVLDNIEASINNHTTPEGRDLITRSYVRNTLNFERNKLKGQAMTKPNTIGLGEYTNEELLAELIYRGVIKEKE